MPECWPKGTLKLTFVERPWNKAEAKPYTYHSREGEPPSAFLGRILKSTRKFDGRATYNYLKDECDEELSYASSDKPHTYKVTTRGRTTSITPVDHERRR